MQEGTSCMCSLLKVPSRTKGYINDPENSSLRPYIIQRQQGMEERQADRTDRDLVKFRCIPKQRTHTLTFGLHFQTKDTRNRRRFVDPGIPRTRVRSALVSRLLTKAPSITLDLTQVKSQVDIIKCCKRALPYSLIVILIHTKGSENFRTKFVESNGGL